MPVPSHEIVCRFIRDSEWSDTLKKPKAKLFKEGQFSVWHERRIERLGGTLDDLRFGALSGAGKVKLTAGEYLEIAKKVALRTEQSFRIQIQWRPEDKFVTKEWRQWRSAHAQAEILEQLKNLDGSSSDFPPEFRDLVGIMATRKDRITPPDRYL